MSVPAPAIISAFQLAGRKNGKEKGTNPFQGHLSEYTQHCCLHSVNKNLITWPHLAAKGGWQKNKIKIFILSKYVPKFKKWGVYYCNTGFIEWNNVGFWGRTNVHWMRLHIQDIYTSRPQTLPKCWKLQHLGVTLRRWQLHLGGSTSLKF